MSRTSAPASRNLAALPPVETISTPCRVRPAASASRPLLSEREMSARRTGTTSVIIAPLTGPAELPADLTAKRQDLADNGQLGRSVGLAAAVDPQAFLGRQTAATAAEVPRRRAFRTQDRAHAVGG